jgi:putative chitinase
MIGTFLITREQLQAMMPNLKAKPERLALHYEPLLAAMREAEIEGPLRIAAYLAQIAHESYQLRYMYEVWGPTPQQMKYERPMIDGKLAPLSTNPDPKKWPLWQKLGNLQPGDGYRFRGAGPIQVTGRENHGLAGKTLNLPLLTDDKLAFTTAVGHRLGAWYWTWKNLNHYADQRDFLKITHLINGGENGLAEREAFYRANLKILGA